MEPKFQTSFIPKKPIVSTQSLSAPVIRTTNIFSLVSTIVFIAVLVVSGGLFFYKNSLNEELLQADVALDEARNAFKTDEIKELIDANSRLMVTNDLLNQHVAVSELLLFLQEVTLKKVRFDEFVYKNDGGSPSIGMKAEAASYNALASQGEIFSKSEFIKSPYFSDFSPTDNGFVRATFFSKIDPTLVSYKRVVESLSINQ